VRNFERPPFYLCAQCGAALGAPIWAEHLNDRHVRNLWSCEACGYQFETSAYFAARNDAHDLAQPPEAHARLH
jgi:ribosomal protein L37AE/L43A